MNLFVGFVSSRASKNSSLGPLSNHQTLEPAVTEQAAPAINLKIIFSVEEKLPNLHRFLFLKEEFQDFGNLDCCGSACDIKLRTAHVLIHQHQSLFAPEILVNGFHAAANSEK